MSFVVETAGEGATGRHRTKSAEFWSVEQRMGGAPDKPNPLEMLLGSLTGCMNVVLQIVASEKGWPEVGAKYQATGEIDPRGMMGDPEIPPYFRHVALKVQLAGVPVDDVDFVRQEVGRRCPVHRLMEQAGVRIEETWNVVG